MSGNVPEALYVVRLFRSDTLATRPTAPRYLQECVGCPGMCLRLFIRRTRWLLEEPCKRVCSIRGSAHQGCTGKHAEGLRAGAGEVVADVAVP